MQLPGGERIRLKPTNLLQVDMDSCEDPEGGMSASDYEAMGRPADRDPESGRRPTWSQFDAGRSGPLHEQ